MGMFNYCYYYEYHEHHKSHHHHHMGNASKHIDVLQKSQLEIRKKADQGQTHTSAFTSDKTVMFMGWGVRVRLLASPDWVLAKSGPNPRF